MQVAAYFVDCSVLNRVYVNDTPKDVAQAADKLVETVMHEVRPFKRSPCTVCL